MGLIGAITRISGRVPPFVRNGLTLRPVATLFVRNNRSKN